MANWKIWPVDRMANRVTSADISCNVQNALIPRVVDCRQGTVWFTGVTTAPKISMLMDSDHTIGAVAFGNIRNASGEAIALSYGATLGAETTAVATITAPNLEDWLYETGITGPATGPGWVARFTTSVATNLSIGTISLLDVNAVIEFDTRESPDFPIIQNIAPGWRSLPLASGDDVRQMLRGASRKWILNFGALGSGANETYREIQNSLLTYNGWVNGVWLTTDEFDNSTDQRAYYCVPAPQQDIGMMISQAGPYGEMTLELHELSKGPR